MKIVDYIPGMQITNTAQLPKGSGAKYLEVLDPAWYRGPFIAIRWLRTQPKKLDKGRMLIRFAK